MTATAPPPNAHHRQFRIHRHPASQKSAIGMTGRTPKDSSWVRYITTRATITSRMFRVVGVLMARSSRMATMTTTHWTIWYMRMSRAWAASTGARANSANVAICRRRRFRSTIGRRKNPTSRIVATYHSTLMLRSQAVLSWVNPPTTASRRE